MNKFLALNVFTRVIENGSFTAASRKLGMSVSAVTKTIARLEDELGVQLLNRTTRQLNPTDYGQEFYTRCAAILADLEDAETTLRAGSVAARGRVRMIVPFSFGRVTLVPELPVFFERFPEIDLEINFSDNAVDLIDERYDLAVRTGQISDSRLITRLLTRSRLITVASRGYLARRGEPRSPADLKDHNCIVGRFGPEWRFRGENGREMAVGVSGNAVINSGDALREAAVAGLGIVQGTWWLMRKDLESGAVVSILTDYALEGAAISVLYAANRHLPRKTRVVLDFLIDITHAS